MFIVVHGAGRSACGSGRINVRFRDIKHTLPFMLQVWMYASPIVYPLSMVPEKWRMLYSLNPMVGVIEGFRWALLGKQSPDLHAMGVSLAVILVLLGGGLIFFKQHGALVRGRDMSQDIAIRAEGLGKRYQLRRRAPSPQFAARPACGQAGRVLPPRPARTPRRRRSGR